jgi:alkaline phosphatase D
VSKSCSSFVSDHDYGINNAGDDYKCPQESQNEFVYHFNVPSSDPRHPDQGAAQQEGIYSAYMFTKEDGKVNGIHLINMDARYHRSPTFPNYGTCRGANSTMLGAVQWAWLSAELNKPSEIKIIGSGTQILPPTHRDRNTAAYCAYDGPGGTFDAANAAIGEGVAFEGTEYEGWAEIPQERTRLLHLVQESINAGKAKQVIFVSGDQHWAEIMEKKIPARTGQASVTVYEVTASGIDQNWPYVVPNSNRIRPASNSSKVLADTAGDGVFNNTCITPCVDEGRAKQGLTCLFKDNAQSWGVCESGWVTSLSYSNEDTCSGDVLHICSARANYGGIEINWADNEVAMSIFTPHETNAVAARITLGLQQSAPLGTTPTTNPTPSPTLRPSTAKPTKSPSIAPSLRPTSRPTRSPSFSPSEVPTLIPSSNPSLDSTCEDLTGVEIFFNSSVGFKNCQWLRGRKSDIVTFCVPTHR